MCYNLFMSFSNLKNYFCLNLLSLIGYIGCAILLLWVFCFFPETKNLDKLSPDGGREYFIIMSIYTIYYYIAQTIIAVALVFLSFLEKFLEKRNFKLPKLFFYNHPYLFWIGIIFTFLPIILFLFVYLTNLIMANF